MSLLAPAPTGTLAATAAGGTHLSIVTANTGAWPVHPLFVTPLGIARSAPPHPLSG